MSGSELDEISEEQYINLVALMESCPFCAKKDGDVYVVHHHHWVAACQSCDAAGPVCSSAKQAVNAWNKRK